MGQIEGRHGGTQELIERCQCLETRCGTSAIPAACWIVLSIEASRHNWRPVLKEGCESEGVTAQLNKLNESCIRGLISMVFL